MRPLFPLLVTICLSASTCFGQVRAIEPNSAEGFAARIEYERAIARKKAEFAKGVESGRTLFGIDDRWSVEKYSEFGGTLLHKSSDDFQIGDWGCPAVLFEVVGRVGDIECLIREKNSKDTVFLLRGLNTSKVTDGVEFALTYPVVIQNTYSYVAVSGAEKTVLVIERDDQKLQELAEESKYRTWKTKKAELNAKLIDLKGNSVKLERRDDHKIISYSISAFSKQDQKTIREEIKYRKELEKARKEDERKPKGK